MIKLETFIKNDFLLLVIVAITFLNPFFYGYRIAILFSLFCFFKLNKILVLFDNNVIFLFLFSFFYEVFRFINDYSGDQFFIFILPNLFVPSCVYLTGKYFANKYQDVKIRIFFLFFISLTFSLVPLVSIIFQLIENGFLEGARKMYILWNANYEVSPTVYASYFTLNMASIGMVNIKKDNKFQKIITLLIILLFIPSLLCVFRLGTRAQIGLAIASLLGSFLISIKDQSLFRNFIIILTFIFLSYFLVSNFSTELEIMTFFADRLDDDGANINSVGGRLDRWIGSIDALTTDPFGWEFERYGYAHNLWLDVARVGSIFSLLFLIFFTISSIIILLKALKHNKNNLFYRAYTFIFFISIFLLFNVEPIMEGMYLLFLIFCMFIGILKKNLN